MVAHDNEYAHWLEHLEGLTAGGESGVPALVAAIIGRAVAIGASDVHADPVRDGVRLRMRVDGRLLDAGTMAVALRDNLVARCKVLAGLLTYRSDVPQEGAFSDPSSQAEIRVSTFPTLYGERVVLRRFLSEAPIDDLLAVGLPDHVDRRLRRALDAQEGLILVTGPSGAGKTTTLYACLRELIASDPGRSIFTVEDPIERPLEGVVQSAIRPAVGMTFDVGLRSAMRQDPDVLMIGEIRDSESAAIAVQAAMTGHLVLATMHSGTAGSAPLRLLHMGVESHALAAALQLVVAQRLVHRRCPDCAGTGCDACFSTGDRGRVVVAECVSASPALFGELAAQRPLPTDGPDLSSCARALMERDLCRVESVRRLISKEDGRREVS